MMLFKSLIYSKDWLDIVFANRNKDYGAYQLRQFSGKATNIALLIVVSIVAGICGISFIEKAPEEPIVVEKDFDGMIALDTELELPKEVIEEKQEEEKVQQVAKDLSAKDLVKFTEINPTDKSKVTEDIAAEKEILDRQKLLASFNAKGQKGGELITSGTFGTKAQDGGTIGRSLGDDTGGDPHGNEPLNFVEVMPAPVGGMSEFVKWIAQNYKFPQSAQEANVKGLIQVKFVVEKDGSLSSFEILRDMGFGTGKEAINLLQKAKEWNPGIQNGIPVRVAFTLPIRLSTQE